MSKLFDAINRHLSTKLDALAFSDDGVVTDFDTVAKIATIRTSSRKGQGFTMYELSWPKDPQGSYTPDPEPYVTHVTLVYMNNNPELPRIATAYDPAHESNTRESAKRDISTFPTKFSRMFIGKGGF